MPVVTIIYIDQEWLMFIINVILTASVFFSVEYKFTSLCY